MGQINGLDRILHNDPLRGMAHQLQRLVTEERPGACLGCGFEHNCRRDGCAVLRKVSRIVAERGKEDDSWHHL